MCHHHDNGCHTEMTVLWLTVHFAEIAQRTRCCCGASIVVYPTPTIHTNTHPHARVQTTNTKTFESAHNETFGTNIWAHLEYCVLLAMKCDGILSCLLFGKSLFTINVHLLLCGDDLMASWWMKGQGESYPYAVGKVI